MAKKREPRKSGPARVLEEIDRVSLAPLEFEDAMKALLATPPTESSGHDNGDED